jgi:ubiquinone/menaquinone biosynthesis C-methylase UbiE
VVISEEGIIVTDRDSDFGYGMMSIMFAIRDFFAPRRKILEEVGIEHGFCVLDYGCGPGAYVPDTSEMVGPTGKVYALDVHPAAIQKVKRLVEKNDLSNVQTIQSDCDTGLEDHSLDVVLLYDTFHDLLEPRKVLAELHRALKPGGKLSFSDHHLGHNEIMSAVTDGGMFQFAGKGQKTYTYSPA